MEGGEVPHRLQDTMGKCSIQVQKSGCRMNTGLLCVPRNI